MSVNTKVNGQLVPSAGLYKVKVPIQSGDIYSFEERQVGVWADGKPLYQKTIDFGALPNSTSKSVNHGIDNIDYINLVEITAQNSTTKEVLPIPFAHRSNINFSIQASVGATAVTIITAEAQSAFNKTYATVQYTKTTDVAGSGIYVPSGDKAVHYSTDEEVIGTWIDGSTIYRKVLTGLSIQLNGTTWVNYEPSISIDKLINVHAYYVPTAGLMTCAIAEYQYNSSVGIQLTAVQGYNRTVNMLILEYTKTS